MKNNAFITGTLEQILKVLDARSYIYIYVNEENYLFSGYVYEFLSKADFFIEYMDQNIKGLEFRATGTTILIKEATA